LRIRKTLATSAAALVALAALVVAPAASAAGAIALSSPCYVATAIGKGATITVTGTGFPPGEPVFAQIPAPGGLLAFGETTIAADGSLTATIPDVSPESIDPVAEKETMQIKGVLSEQILAEAPFELTNLAVRTKPASAPYDHVVTYVFSGFAPGKPIYGHFLRGGKVVVNHKFGKSTGACGLLQAKSKLFPGNGPSSATYKIQFDDSKKYDPKVTRKIVTKLSAGF
jgi:hypothetical protein